MTNPLSIVIVTGMDSNFLSFKLYLKGQLTSQLLCRLSIAPEKDRLMKDFWKILGVEDEFDRNYISAQVDKISYLYSILEYKEKESLAEENRTDKREERACEREAALQKKVAKNEASCEEQRRR